MKSSNEKAFDGLKNIVKSGLNICPCCGSEKGFSFEPSPVYMACTTDIEKIKEKDFSAFPVLLGRCKNCGYVIQFDARLLSHPSGVSRK